MSVPFRRSDLEDWRMIRFRLLECNDFSRSLGCGTWDAELLYHEGPDWKLWNGANEFRIFHAGSIWENLETTCCLAQDNVKLILMSFRCISSTKVNRRNLSSLLYCCHASVIPAIMSFAGFQYLYKVYRSCCCKNWIQMTKEVDKRRSCKHLQLIAPMSMARAKLAGELLNQLCSVKSQHALHLKVWN